MKPGHYTHECPINDDGNSRENLIEVEEYNHSIDGDHYNHDYDPDGNLNGER